MILTKQSASNIHDDQTRERFSSIMTLVIAVTFIASAVYLFA